MSIENNTHNNSNQNLVKIDANGIQINIDKIPHKILRQPNDIVLIPEISTHNITNTCATTCKIPNSLSATNGSIFKQ